MTEGYDRFRRRRHRDQAAAPRPESSASHLPQMQAGHQESLICPRIFANLPELLMAWNYCPRSSINVMFLSSLRDWIVWPDKTNSGKDHRPPGKKFIIDLIRMDSRRFAGKKNNEWALLR
jgi:hypothetical protein